MRNKYIDLINKCRNCSLDETMRQQHIKSRSFLKMNEEQGKGKNQFTYSSDFLWMQRSWEAVKQNAEINHVSSISEWQKKKNNKKQ